MIDRPVAVRIMEELAKGKQVGYLGSLRKTDASTVIDYIHKLEVRCAAAEADRDVLRAGVPWAALWESKGTECPDYEMDKQATVWLAMNAPEGALPAWVRSYAEKVLVEQHHPEPDAESA